MMSDVDLPVAHIRAQVASAIDVVVHMARLRDGRRVVFRISVVDGLVEGEPEVADVFALRVLGRARGGAFRCDRRDASCRGDARGARRAGLAAALPRRGRTVDGAA